MLIHLMSAMAGEAVHSRTEPATYEAVAVYVQVCYFKHTVIKSVVVFHECANE